mmetsp:Transcript_16623/g.38912  ORF Transcript_16623/g.38912 Transcript_16623/m.38912 type:complete len:362 (-) Transcript_16623:197-1282(-)
MWRSSLLSTRFLLALLLLAWCGASAAPAVCKKSVEALPSLEEPPLMPSRAGSGSARSLLQRSMETAAAHPLALASDAGANISDLRLSKQKAAADVEKGRANNTQDSDAAEEAEHFEQVFAESLRDPSVDMLAIVGNGPLTHAQREEIKQFPQDRIIRFNAMANLMADEPVGHVYANACPGGWWGITALECKRLYDAVEIVLFGEPKKAHEDLGWFTWQWGDKFILGPPDSYSVQIDGSSYHANSSECCGFSIGFKGIGYAHWRYPEAKLHVYGFNWNWNLDATTENRPVHPFAVEKQAVAEMGCVEIHPTAPDSGWHGPPYECEEPMSRANLTSFMQLGAATEGEAWTEWAGEEFPPEMQF